MRRSLDCTLLGQMNSRTQARIRWAEVLRTCCTVVASDQCTCRSTVSRRLAWITRRCERRAQVIAVGGFSLSRGLTLEGLIVSYFLRNSMMYDTLMQMGRWFGYRPGYEDLCRVWMPETAEGWYAHISDAIEELQRRTEAHAGGECDAGAVRPRRSAAIRRR